MLRLRREQRLTGVWTGSDLSEDFYLIQGSKETPRRCPCAPVRGTGQKEKKPWRKENDEKKKNKRTESEERRNRAATDEWTARQQERKEGHRGEEEEEDDGESDKTHKRHGGETCRRRKGSRRRLASRETKGTRRDAREEESQVDVQTRGEGEQRKNGPCREFRITVLSDGTRGYETSPFFCFLKCCTYTRLQSVSTKLFPGCTYTPALDRHMR